MKARIRKTGEIVEVITYSSSTHRLEHLDAVSYIDSKGVEHDREKLNFYWDFEQLPDVKEDNFPNTDWNQVRIQAAIAAMQGLCNSCHDDVIREIQKQNDLERSSVIGFLSVRIADAFVKELKKKGGKG